MLMTALLLVLTGSAYAADGPNVDRWDDWILAGINVSAGDPIRSGGWSKLSNEINKGLSVIYGPREYGINLVWNDAGSYNIKLVRAGSNSSISMGDPVALYVSHGK